MDPVEALSRVIAKSRGHADAQAQVTRDVSIEIDGLRYPPRTQPVWMHYEHTARSVIEAIKENPDMLLGFGISIGANNGPKGEGGGGGGFDASTLNETNTGCRIAEGSLVEHTIFNTTSNNQVITGLKVTDVLNINHPGCTIEDCVIDTVGFRGIYSNTSGTDFPVTIRYCTIRNCQTAISASGLIEYNNIYNVENGIVAWSHGDDLPGDQQVIQYNYIHLEGGWPEASDPHNDGMEIFGIRYCIVRYNKVICTISQDNSGIYVDNSFGSALGLEIYGNYIRGANYALQLDGDNGGPTIDIEAANIYDNSLGEGLFGHVYTNEVGFEASALEATNTFE